MFRAQQNIFDDAVAKATDENLTSENWEYILDVCDRANTEDTGPKDVVSSMIKRLAHRNANVQLYTLELANALSQNCGPKVHRELASRSFTDALLRLASDRNTHQQVKAKILEHMAEWAEMFSRDPDLGIMEQAYMKLKSQNPNLHPPSKPTKRQITDVDRQKEEDELQMALALSVKAQTPTASSSSQKAELPGISSSISQAAPPAQPVSSGTTAATISRVRALFDFQPSEPGELQFKKGDIIAVLESVYKDWWKGSLRGQTGIFPLNYVEKLADPTEDELQREAQMEAEVFAEIKNVEKLLTLLSTSNSELNVRDNEEITTLYHSTLAIRPKLIELIGKYSQRKDDFTQLNEKFIKARRDYESLLEASMSQPSQSAYGRPGQPQYGHAGGYPPQGPPPQHDVGRYYSPNPPDGRPPQGQNAPQSGPAPFYLAGQSSSQQIPQSQYPPQDPRNRIPTGNVPPPSGDPYHRRPQSTYDHPQELGTSSYASPTEAPPQHQSHFQPQLQSQGSEYSPSIYSPDDAALAQQPPASTQYPQQYHGSQQPFGQGPPPQSIQRPPQASSPGPQNPGLPNPYPVLNSGPPTGPYKAYQPPTAPQQHGYASGGANDPNDFYR
ncbi:ESCRT-0 subunit protein hse1 [Ptychographa xylographoides]|nr:ESCRT-0 subunit protein hse1 [Ptychographa xylographoides]